MSDMQRWLDLISQIVEPEQPCSSCPDASQEEPVLLVVQDNEDENTDGSMSPMSDVSPEVNDDCPDDILSCLSDLEISLGETMGTVNNGCGCKDYNCSVCFPLTESELEHRRTSHVAEDDFDQVIDVGDEVEDDSYTNDAPVRDASDEDTGEKIGKILYMQDMGMSNSSYSPEKLQMMQPEMVDRIYKKVVGEGIQSGENTMTKRRIKEADYRGSHLTDENDIRAVAMKLANGEINLEQFNDEIDGIQYSAQSQYDAEMGHMPGYQSRADDESDREWAEFDAMDNWEDSGEFDDMDESLKDMKGWMNTVFEADDEDDEDLEEGEDCEDLEEGEDCDTEDDEDCEDLEEAELNWDDRFDNDREAGIDDLELNFDFDDGGPDEYGLDAFDQGDMVSFDDDAMGSDIEFDDPEMPLDYELGLDARDDSSLTGSGPRVQDRQYRKDMAARRGGPLSRPGYESAIKAVPGLNESKKTKMNEGADADVIKAMKALFD